MQLTRHNPLPGQIRLDAYTAMAANMLVAVVLCLAVFPFHGHLSLSAQIDNSKSSKEARKYKYIIKFDIVSPS